MYGYTYLNMYIGCNLSYEWPDPAKTYAYALFYMAGVTKTVSLTYVELSLCANLSSIEALIWLDYSELGTFIKTIF